MRFWLRTIPLIYFGFCCEGFTIADEKSTANETFPEQSWTYWYNADDPYDGNDIETVRSLTEYGYRLCGSRQIVEAECRVFSMPTHNGTGEVRTICDINGLQCFSTGSSVCPNYEVRFRCQDFSNQADDDEEFSDNFEYRYYFILVIIPIIALLFRVICPYYLQKKRERHEQVTGAEAGISAQEIINSFNAPPPSYLELFGNNFTLLPINEHDLSSRKSCGKCGRFLAGDDGGNIASSSQDPVRNVANVLFCVCGPVPESSLQGIDNPIFIVEDESRRGWIGMPQLYNLNTPPPNYEEALEILHKGRTNITNANTHL